MSDNQFKYAENEETYRYLKILKDRDEKSQPVAKENIKVVDTDILLEHLDDRCIEDLSNKEINQGLFEDAVMSALSFIGNSEYVYLKSWYIKTVRCNKGNEFKPTQFALEGSAISTTNEQMVILVENVDVDDKYSKPVVRIKKDDKLESFGSFLDYLDK
jgi:hypothetical protein